MVILLQHSNFGPNVVYFLERAINILVFLLTEPPLKISFSCFLTPRKGFKLAFGALGSDSPHEGAIQRPQKIKLEKKKILRRKMKKLVVHDNIE